MEIISYLEKYEESWLRCRVLSFLHSAMYEDVVTKKPQFENQTAIELIAIENDEVIGILDILIDDESNKATFLRKEKGAFIELIAVHPDHQNKGIAQKLYDEGLARLHKYKPQFIELFTRNDEAANKFYKKQGFDIECEYYVAFGIQKGLRKPIKSDFSEGLLSVTGVGEDKTNYDYVIVDGKYEVYNKAGLELIDYDRYYPVYGYVKELKGSNDLVENVGQAVITSK
ncbi:GNAT family N-acetyltransferase [Viridibacillus arvi]|uniref:GNAT family N-acetyltransferase n=1 Tax=Viridibacillus arvi TaxID=263475 RepID=UPI003CFCBB06